MSKYPQKNQPTQFGQKPNYFLNGQNIQNAVHLLLCYSNTHCSHGPTNTSAHQDKVFNAM